MCGILGIVNYNRKSVDEATIKTMMAAMKHRGPDDEGYFCEDSIGLGFVRLSILDLSLSGHQPMFSSDERYVIVFNGEVYNYLEIKKELEDKYKFKSSTDTEVVLYAYIAWGESCLEKFNGMFAFVIYDRLNKSIFGARDRFGIKPFYYSNNYKQFTFASDVNSLLKNSDLFVKPNDSVILNYLLTNRTNYSEETFFENIVKLNPGHLIKIDDQNFSIKKWYDIENHTVVKGFKNSEEYKIELNNSISLQLRSDVPIGICLSGGLDSSSIASLLINDFSITKLHSYSAIYNKGDQGDETAFINLFKDKGIEMHFAKPNASDFLKDINNYVRALGEPVPNTSEYAEYKVMELAKKHSKVVMNGQGADEVLGGYDYFYAAYLKELLFHFKLVSFFKECYFLVRHKKLLLTLKYLFFYCAPVSLKCFALKKRSNILQKRFYQKQYPEAKRLIKSFYEFKSINQFFKNHLKLKFEHHLLWADKSGMYFSVETRFPFIDHHLIEKTLSTEPDKILNKGWTKNILREGLKEKLDDQIRLRKDKIGFETPESNWFREKEFQNFTLEILNSSTFKSRKYFNSERVIRLYEEHIKGINDNASIIWKCLNLELWLREFIDNRKNEYKNDNSFAIITPVKNEAEYIEQTIKSVINQTIIPKIWVIVDDGSTDETSNIVTRYCEKYTWIKLIKLNNKNDERAGGSKVINAFYAGLRTIQENDYEFIVKLDGDLSLSKNYFEKILEQFNKNPQLGICGGVILNKYSNELLIEEKVDSFNVRGALKMIRKKCWDDIGGFKKIWYWDTLDVLEAKFNDWETLSIDIPVVHYRPTSSAYNPNDHAYKCGYEAYKFGSGFSLTILRFLKRLLKKPFLSVGFAYLKGYLDARAKNENILLSPSIAKLNNKIQLNRINILSRIFSKNT